jgi:hypothetical protein
LRHCATSRKVAVSISDEFIGFFNLPNPSFKSRRMRWAGRVAQMMEKRNASRILVGKPEGKRPLGRPRRRWVNNIKMDVREIELGGMDWIDLVQDRDQWMALVNTIMNVRVP